MFESSPELISPRAWLRTGRARGGSWRRPVIAAGIGLGAIALLVGLVLGLRGVLRSLGTEETGYAHDSKAYNYRYHFPDSPWVADRDAQLGLKASFAMRRAEPTSRLALLVKDYKDRAPRDADLVEEALRRLREYFKGLEWERRPDATLAGKRGPVLEFQGEVDNVLVGGDCRMTTHNGYAYWFVTWAPLPDRDVAVEGWEGVRQRLTLLKGREGWTEKPPRSAAAAGTKGAYGLRYAEEIWQKQRLEGYDPAADLVLLGNEPGEGRLAAKAATVQVLILPKQPDLRTAMDMARTRLLEQQKQEGYPQTAIEGLADQSGVPVRLGDIGGSRGYIARLHVRNTDARELYVVLAVLLEPDHVLAIQCQCQWTRKEYWDQEFGLLLDTFRLARLQ